jgi:hypothetical protein
MRGVLNLLLRPRRVLNLLIGRVGRLMLRIRICLLRRILLLRLPIRLRDRGGTGQIFLLGNGHLSLISGRAVWITAVVPQAGDNVEDGKDNDGNPKKKTKTVC